VNVEEVKGNPECQSRVREISGLEVFKLVSELAQVLLPPGLRDG